MNTTTSVSEAHPAERIRIVGPDAEPQAETVAPEPDPEPVLPPAALDETLAASTAQEPALFDNAPYLKVPTFDGQPSDKLTIAFAGSVSFDASDEEGQELFASLRLGRPVELRVAGTVASKAGTYKISKTDVETVTGKAGVKIETVYLLAPEALG